MEELIIKYDDKDYLNLVFRRKLIILTEVLNQTQREQEERQEFVLFFIIKSFHQGILQIYNNIKYYILYSLQIIVIYLCISNEALRNKIIDIWRYIPHSQSSGLTEVCNTSHIGSNPIGCFVRQGRDFVWQRTNFLHQFIDESFKLVT